MAFPKKLLNSYESITLDLNPHWWYLAHPTGALIGSIALVGFSLTRDGDGTTNDVLRWVSLAALVFSALWLVVRYMKWVTTNFVITTDRLIYRSGLVAKRGVQIPLERVNNVNFSQGIFERMIGAGDLLIESGGQDGQQRFTDIRHPDQVTNLIHEAMEGNESRRRGVADSPVAGTDVYTQMEKLEGLLQRGSITQEEFDAQKRKLLG